MVGKYSSYKEFQLITESWRKFVNEQEDPAAPAHPNREASPAQAEAPGTDLQINAQTSFKVFKNNPKLAALVMSELLKGGDLFKQLQQAQLKTDKETGEPAGPAWFQIKSPQDLAQWVEGIGGIETFAKRAAAIGGKIPEQGLPKSKMPFLPGPPDATGDVKDVEDALTPGGKYNVDMMEKINPPKVNAIGHVSKDPNAATFMQSGHNDGNPDDDKIEIQLGGGFPAAKGIPTQTNILLPKGLGMAVKGISGGNLDAYASLKGQILDGHHRWAATMLNDPSADIGTVARVDLDTLGTDETLRYLTAIGNALGNVAKTA